MRKVVVKTFGPDENGDVAEYFEGYIDSSEFDSLPTEHVADGSNVIESNNGKWDFFNEKSKTWGTLLTLGE